MNAKDLQYFKIIGQLHTSISLSENFNDAVTASLKIVLANCVADYAVIWRADNSEMPVLRPMYWICPVDLSSCSCRAGEGLVGRVFVSQKSKTVFDCKNDSENAWLDDFSGLDVGSVACLPLNSGEQCYGCVQFIKAAEKLSERHRGLNLIMISGSEQYAVDAFRLHVSDFWLYPYTAERVEEAFNNLRHTPQK